MTAPHRVVILVGHGGLPRDCPDAWVRELKRLEGLRKSRGGPPSAEEREIDHQIRTWPRTPESDPYKAGLEAVGARLAPRLPGRRLVLAYNEFCAPSLEQAVEEVIAGGHRHLTVVPSMLTPGGAHAELEIPQTLRALEKKHPTVSIHYAWPFDLERLAGLFHEQIENTESSPQ